MKSDNVKKGMQQAPHRSLFNALGFTEEEMNKPMVGIVPVYSHIRINQICYCNIAEVIINKLLKVFPHL